MNAKQNQKAIETKVERQSRAVGSKPGQLIPVNPEELTRVEGGAYGCYRLIRGEWRPTCFVR